MEWASFFIGFLSGAVVATGCCAVWAYKAMKEPKKDEHDTNRGI